MTSSITFVLFLALVCIAAAQRLPFREGTTLGSLWESSLWENLANASNRLSKEVEHSIENWTEYVAEELNKRIVGDMTDSFLAGYSDEEINRKQDTVNYGESASFPDVMEETFYRPYDQFIADLNALREEGLEIIGDLPNWLNLEALRQVDLSKVELSPETSLNRTIDYLSDVLSVPDKELQKIEAFVDSTTQLIPSHGYKLGAKAAGLVKHLQDLAVTYMPTVTQIVSSSLQSYSPLIIPFLTSNLGSLIPTLSVFL